MHIDEKKKFDKRTIDRELREGFISPKEYKEYLKSLPDISDKIYDAEDKDVIEEESKREKGT